MGVTLRGRVGKLAHFFCAFLVARSFRRLVLGIVGSKLPSYASEVSWEVLVGAETKHVETVMLERGKAQEVALANRKIAKKKQRVFFWGGQVVYDDSCMVGGFISSIFFMFIPILGEINPI